METLGSPLLIGIILGAGLMYVGLQQEKSRDSSTALEGPVKYNCELSDGTFKDGKCVCQIESFQNQEEMYDKNTGFCESTHGGPAGNAWNASVGLPYGQFDHWFSIIGGQCKNSGGDFINARCECSSGKNYDKTTGQCK